MKNTLKLITVATWILIGCTSMHPQQVGSQPIDHSTFDELLKKHVNTSGMVNYKGFMKDSTQLNAYISTLEKNGPDEKVWTPDQQLAYWMNMYNALTIRTILRYYPVKSIKEIGSSIQIPYVNTAWDIQVITIGGKSLSLNNIEHNIIRKNFEEPRIHFTLVCAAMSCPILRNEAYVATKLEAQFTDQIRNFLNDPTRNKITSNKLIISKLFSWYEGDFTKNGSLVDYLNQYTDIEIYKKARKSFMNYDWSLNEQ